MAACLSAGTLAGEDPIAKDASGGDSVPFRFAGEPAKALIHRIDASGGSTGAPAGLLETRTARRIADLPLPALRIDSTIENRTGSPLDLARSRLLDWKLRPTPVDDARYREMSPREDTWYGSTYWTGPDWTRVGRDWQHPGERTESVRRFTAPRDGRVSVRGRVAKAHLEGDGIRAEIRHRGRTIWTAEIEGKDAVGQAHEISLEVLEGEALRFVIHRRGAIPCDTTRWDPAIEYEGGPRFLASEGFSARAKDGPWTCETDVGEAARVAGPRLLAFDPAWSVREIELAAVDTPPVPMEEARSDSKLMPLLLLSDERQSSGVVIVGDPKTRWRAHCTTRPDGTIQIEVSLADGGDGLDSRSARLEAGETRSLPAVVASPYRGSLLDGLETLERLLGEPAVASIAGGLREAIDAAGVPELPLWKMVQDEWRREDAIDEASIDSFARAIDRHSRDLRTLLDELKIRAGGLRAEDPRLADGAHERELQEIVSAPLRLEGLKGELRERWTRLRSLKRRILLGDPSLARGEIFFAKRAPTSYSHLVMQYYGWRARAGGGLFALEKPGRSLAARDLLCGRLETGNVLEPRLSYDAKRVVFSYVEVGNRSWDPALISNDDPDTEGFYHIHEAATDGSSLRQLTHGPHDDLMPTYLPDGDIVFVSTRRKGYARCFGAQFSRRWHVYTLHRMSADGRDIRPLSFHDTNEWFPTIANDGRILYARWDYIDRDAVTHQNLWATRPDGSNPVAVWGNAAPSPHCTFQAQAIPGSHKIVFTASAHHSTAGGPIVVLDPSIDPNEPAALERIGSLPFPEAESREIPEYYEAPWPLCESLFLVAWSPEPLVWEPGENPRNALGLYLLDRTGRRELLYRDPKISSTNPCPLVARPVPPVLPSHLASGNLAPGGQVPGGSIPGDSALGGSVPGGSTPGGSGLGEVLLVNVYEGLEGAAPGSVRELRIVQIFPKSTPIANQPPIGIAGEENARAILGTVPVEADGSASFLLPAGKPVLFQALDADGVALRTMRSVAYVHAGEKVSCVGCHERPTLSPPARGARELAALRRPPSIIEAGSLGGRPFSYVEVVQPILDRRCTSCHGGEKPAAALDLSGEAHGDYSRSYVSLCVEADARGREAGGGPGENAKGPFVARFAARDQLQITPPLGPHGARGSRLLRMLREGHGEVELDQEELRRLAAWIDLNAIFFGSNLPEDQARQRRGETLSMPAIQ